MSLSVGIVGLANVGKSTLFEALTKKQVNISNYPFCTIEPNIGIVEVPDERVDKLAAAFNSVKKIPAIIKFVDIAGLVRGANKGEGLGNQFLANIREMDALLFVVRCFENAEIMHVEKTIDPARDIDIVNMELILKDLETVDKRMQKAKEPEEQAFFRKLKAWLEQGNLARQLRSEVGAPAETSEFLKELQLLTDKPSIFILNSNTSELPPALVKKIKELNSEYIIANLRDEFDASKLTEEDKKELGLGESKLGEIVKKSYQALGLITFFTTGPDETRAWTIKQGTLAPQASGVIHTDFEKKFICALVINWEKLLNKELPQTQGKEYAVLDGDVIEVKHG
ncbi:MAG: redox-regulated ATPase YchF [Candidatus Wildermuthbacteria bacterium]|nr:redox-regulated ATPase YchF [Candidatus Wildermuthbacteria bacterium]